MIGVLHGLLPLVKIQLLVVLVLLQLDEHSSFWPFRGVHL